jgi:hypothetical protein
MIRKKKLMKVKKILKILLKFIKIYQNIFKKKKFRKKKYQALVNREKKIEERYRQVRAPYKKKQKKDIGIEYFTS